MATDLSVVGFMGIEQTLSTPLAAAVRAAGSQSAFGRVIKRSQSTIYQWLLDDKPLPGEYVLTVEGATGIPRTKLRPDLYPSTDSFPGKDSAPATGTPA